MLQGDTIAGGLLVEIKRKLWRRYVLFADGGRVPLAIWNFLFQKITALTTQSWDR